MRFETRQDVLDAIKILEDFQRPNIPEIVQEAIDEYAAELRDHLKRYPTPEEEALFPEAIRLASLYAKKRGWGRVTHIDLAYDNRFWSAATVDGKHAFKISNNTGLAGLQAGIDWLRSQVGE